MIAWLLVAFGVVAVTAITYALNERDLTWRLPAALCLAPVVFFAWWVALKNGATYTRHGMAWDVSVAVSTAAIGFVVAGEPLTSRRMVGIAIGVLSIALLATESK